MSDLTPEERCRLCGTPLPNMFHDALSCREMKIDQLERDLIDLLGVNNDLAKARERIAELELHLVAVLNAPHVHAESVARMEARNYLNSIKAAATNEGQVLP